MGIGRANARNLESRFYTARQGRTKRSLRLTVHLEEIASGHVAESAFDYSGCYRVTTKTINMQAQTTSKKCQ
jgi:hypothetical protein